MTKRYKFLHSPDGEQLCSIKGHALWQIGEQKSVTGMLVMCNNGFHCSQKVLDAFAYVQGEALAEVEVSGDFLVSNDEQKECWRSMRLLRVWKWGPFDLLSIILHMADGVLPLFEQGFPNDHRGREVLKAVHRYVEGGEADAAVYPMMEALRQLAYVNHMASKHTQSAVYAARAIAAAGHAMRVCVLYPALVHIYGTVYEGVQCAIQARAFTQPDSFAAFMNGEAEFNAWLKTYIEQLPPWPSRPAKPEHAPAEEGAA